MRNKLQSFSHPSLSELTTARILMEYASDKINYNFQVIS